MADAHDRIEAMIQKYPVMLFMKGTPDQPQCGFSQRVSMVLKDYGKPFASFDVLSDPEVRQGIKDYGQFPTIPQLYVGGELVGGSDIVSEMYIAGELQDLLDKATAAAE